MKNIFPKYTELSYFLSSGFSLVLLAKGQVTKMILSGKYNKKVAAHGNDKHTHII